MYLIFVFFWFFFCFKAVAAPGTLLTGRNIHTALPCCSRLVGDRSLQAVFVSIPHPFLQQPLKTLFALQYSRILVLSFVKLKICSARAIALVCRAEGACRQQDAGLSQLFMATQARSSCQSHHCCSLPLPRPSHSVPGTWRSCWHPHAAHCDTSLQGGKFPGPKTAG